MATRAGKTTLAESREVDDEAGRGGKLHEIKIGLKGLIV